jgi:SET domain-containing protein
MESVLPIVSSLVDQDGSIGEETIRQAGNSIAVVAKRDLEAGEEVTISYLGHMGDQPVFERRKFLRNRYGFECDCALCQNEIPDAVFEE